MGTPNPWLPLVQTTLVHPNEHLCKTQRALWHFAEWYGGAGRGAFAALAHVASDDAGAAGGAEGGGLDGAEVLDGTLFVRAAGLSADRLGWMREGEAQRGWDADGFFGVGDADEARREKQQRLAVQGMWYG